MFLTIDIETYGKAETTHDGRGLPAQTVFHPYRSLHSDRVEQHDLILTCALTIGELEWPDPNPSHSPMPLIPPRSSRHLPLRRMSDGHFTATSPSPTSRRGWISSTNQPWPMLDGPSLASLTPTRTMVLRLWLKEERQWLGKWLQRATVLLGHNIAFDMMYLRALGYPVSRRHLLLDSSILSYLETEIRPERSLKSISPLLGTHVYDDAIVGSYRFPKADDPGMAHYNSEDTHATTLNAAEHAKRVLTHGPQTHKLSTPCLHYYSDCLWCCIEKAESGLPMNRDWISSLEHHHLSIKKYAERASVETYGLRLRGTGSMASQDAFVSEVVGAIDTDNDNRIEVIGENPVPTILAHPLLEISKKTGRISWSKVNRELFLDYAKNPTHRGALLLAKTHRESEKLTNTFTTALLRPKTTGKSTNRCKNLLLPQTTWPVKDFPRNPAVHLGYTSWYVTPSALKDEGGDEGGQLQARPSCKGPPAQTFPPILRQGYQSRFEGGTILAADLSQHELRTAALLSGDPYLVKAYQEDQDLHRERAIQIWGEYVLDLDNFEAYYRQAAKHTNFTDVNRGGPDMLRHTIKKKGGFSVTKALCQQIVDDRRSQRPGLMEWQDRVLYEAYSNRYLELPYVGISRTFYPGSYQDNEIVNFPIQGVAAAVMWCWEHHFMAHHAQDLGVYPFLNHYDALWIDCPPGASAGTRDALQESLRVIQTEGLWSWLIEDTTNEVPLGLDVKELPPPPELPGVGHEGDETRLSKLPRLCT